MDRADISSDTSAEYAARHFGKGRRGFPRKGPANPSEVGVRFFGICCSFEFSRDRHCHETRKCPHRLSSDKLIRLAVPSQLRVSLHAWRLPRRFKNASKLWRRCSTPQHTRHRATHHKNKTCTSRSMEEGFDGVVRGACVQNARLTCRTGHGSCGVGTAQPTTYRPERTDEGDAEPEGGRAAPDCVTVTFRSVSTRCSGESQETKMPTSSSSPFLIASSKCSTHNKHAQTHFHTLITQTLPVQCST